MGPAVLIPGPCSRLGTRLFLESSFKPQLCVTLLRPLAGSQVYILSSGPNTHPVLSCPPPICVVCPTHTHLWPESLASHCAGL